MSADFQEWLHLFLRWFHVIAGISWIGQTYLFHLFEKRIVEAVDSGSAEPKMWMVHGGGFYGVEKRPFAPPMPTTLQWFKWESALTWMSGLLLLILVYYAGGAVLDPESSMGPATAIGIGLGTLIGGWALYNLVWSSPLGRNELVGAAVSFAILLAIAYELAHVLSPRATYIHVGAMFGTIMAANVWMRILPAQRRAIAAVARGERPDEAALARAKRSSKHNTFMSVPVVFIMLSNHFPTISYGHDLNWLILGGLVLAGWGAAWWMRS